jgi:hypothetical protein
MNTVPFENAPAADIAQMLERQRELRMMENVIAELLYRARAIFIGGMALPWGVLSEGQRTKYRMEAKQLIQGEQ